MIPYSRFTRCAIYSLAVLMASCGGSQEDRQSSSAAQSQSSINSSASPIPSSSSISSQSSSVSSALPSISSQSSSVSSPAISNQPPVAEITVSGSLVGLTPFNVRFGSDNSSDDIAITLRQWDFQSNNEYDSVDANPSFSFSQPGSYSVQLTVYDEDGATDTAQVTIEARDTFGFMEDRYSANCSLCHGVSGEGGPGSPALIRQWTTEDLRPSVERMVELHGDCQSVEQNACVDALTTYISTQFIPNTEEPTTAESHLINTPIKALNKTEFFNTLEDVFSISFSQQEKTDFNLPLDSSASRYSTDSTLRVLRGISTDTDVLDDLYPALTRVHNSLLEKLNSTALEAQYSPATGCNFTLVTSSSQCQSAYRSAILSKAFRRTITPSDSALTTASAIYDIYSTQGMEAQEAFIQSIASYVIFSPEFLFHSHRGDSADSHHQLNPQELAHKISYLIWGAAADTELLSYDWGSLLEGTDDTILDEQLIRLFNDGKSRYFINTFTGQWLKLETDIAQVLTATADDNRADEFAQAIKAESEHFIRHLIIENENINRLINADYTFMNSTLADFYQISVPGLTEEFNQVYLSSVPALNNRKGLLTQANFLTTGTKSDRPATVHRGVTILKDVMCHIIGPPSGEVPDIGDIDRSLHTESALFRMVTESDGSSCYGCHQNINPISFPFEAFDRLGRHPVSLSLNGSLPEYAVYEAVGIPGNQNANGPTEKADTFYLDKLGGSINFSTDYGRLISGSFNNHQELIALLDQTPAFSECLTDHLYDFVIGTNAERGVIASNSDNTSQHTSQTASKRIALDAAPGLRTLLLNLIKRPEFRMIRRD